MYEAGPEAAMKACMHGRLRRDLSRQADQTRSPCELRDCGQPSGLWAAVVSGSNSAGFHRHLCLAVRTMSDRVAMRGFSITSITSP